MAKITKIIRQKKSSRINIYIEGDYAFSVFESALIDYNLFKGREILAKEIKSIKDQDDFQKCMESSFRYLSYRPRSEKEVKDKLRRKYSPNNVDAVIKKLKEKDYINDEEFVSFWLENRIKNRGPLLLKNELRQKGIRDELIKSALSGFNRNQVIDNAKTLILSNRRFKGLDEKESFRKITPYLARRGYPFEIIKETLKEITKKTSAE
ncbi:MAG: RecX family transcriptional regulator [Patescibacteria group bacterium]|nr:RecX family transcriptional regulator [Patescibacteria group bacterium]